MIQFKKGHRLIKPLEGNTPKICKISYDLGREFGEEREYDSFGDPVDEYWYLVRSEVKRLEETPIPAEPFNFWTSPKYRKVMAAIKAYNETI